MRRSSTRLRGLGEQIIKILAAELRDIADLPDEVEILAVFPAPNQGYAPEAVFDQFPLVYVASGFRYAFIHVLSRYAIRRPRGAALTIEGFEEFMQRYEAMRSQKK